MRSYLPNAAGIAKQSTDAGWRLPCGLLPRMVRMEPGHTPSTCVFWRRLPDRVTSFGARRRRWQRIARTECGCGWSFGRITPAVPGDRQTDLPLPSRTGLGDVQVSGAHATHTQLVRRRETMQEAA